MTIHVDAIGDACPVPVIKLNDAARGAEPGTTIEVLADDPAAEIDIPAWCAIKEHHYLGRTQRAKGWAYEVRLRQDDRIA